MTPESIAVMLDTDEVQLFQDEKEQLAAAIRQWGRELLERAAKLMEGDVRTTRRENKFCRLVDHMQEMCECAERADAIRGLKEAI